MALVSSQSLNCQKPFVLATNQNGRPRLCFLKSPRKGTSFCICLKTLDCLPMIPHPRRLVFIVNGLEEDSTQKASQEEEVQNLGVKTAVCMLRFYKREISPLLPNSCRYVPTCSEYSMEAYKRYGVVKGTILTAWRLCRCNPLGGSGFDPPRWFDERSPPEQ
ncbi:putative membrane protein insertion efficiency factor isoform X1 [Telopea speciosissima]|uniref:putative membrane protein insertion efficiency factor isoform X1 n=1 Tax=Telopea speciosissima TaxID=54955 RepID=UPI001CC36418|nr:putative membrane protein insertion efficiency factor isoform X1 [Telopea speciosissima]